MYRIKLARGNFSQVDTNYEYQVERAGKESKDVLGKRMISRHIQGSFWFLGSIFSRALTLRTFHEGLT